MAVLMFYSSCMSSEPSLSVLSVKIRMFNVGDRNEYLKAVLSTQTLATQSRIVVGWKVNCSSLDFRRSASCSFIMIKPNFNQWGDAKLGEIGVGSLLPRELY